MQGRDAVVHPQTRTNPSGGCSGEGGNSKRRAAEQLESTPPPYPACESTPPPYPACLAALRDLLPCDFAVALGVGGHVVPTDLASAKQLHGVLKGLVRDAGLLDVDTYKFTLEEESGCLHERLLASDHRQLLKAAGAAVAYFERTGKHQHLTEALHQVLDLGKSGQRCEISNRGTIEDDKGRMRDALSEVLAYATVRQRSLQQTAFEGMQGENNG